MSLALFSRARLTTQSSVRNHDPLGTAQKVRINSNICCERIKPGVSPVYTLNMPLSKTYVVTTPEFISFVDRRPGTFSFNPILVEFSKRILTVSQPSWEKLARGTLEESGKHELSHDLLRAGQESMKPGEDLECLAKRMLTSSISFFDCIDVESPESNYHDLYDWCRKYVTV